MVTSFFDRLVSILEEAEEYGFHHTREGTLFVRLVQALLDEEGIDDGNEAPPLSDADTPPGTTKDSVGPHLPYRGSGSGEQYGSVARLGRDVTRRVIQGVDILSSNSKSLP